MRRHPQDPPANVLNGDADPARTAKLLFATYFDDLTRLARAYGASSDDEIMATEALEDVCRQLAEERQIDNLDSYLKQAVRNRCRDRLRHLPPKTVELPPDAPAPADEPADEDSDYPTLCQQVLDAAGFLQPPDLKPLFYDLLASEHRSRPVPPEVEEAILRLTGRRAIRVQACRAFLKAEVQALRRGASRLIEYRAVAQRLVAERLPGASPEVWMLLVEVHMVTTPWQGWPRSSMRGIIRPSRTPARLAPLAAALDNHHLRRDPAALVAILNEVAREMGACVLEWGWPMSTPPR